MARKAEDGPAPKATRHGGVVVPPGRPWGSRRTRGATGESGADLRLIVAHHVRRHRLAAGLRQEELAGRCGLDRTYVSGIERGRRNPTVLVLGDLAAALGVCVADLLRQYTSTDGALGPDDASVPFKGPPGRVSRRRS